MYIFEDGEKMYRKRLLKSVQVDSGGGGGGGGGGLVHAKIPSVIVGIVHAEEMRETAKQAYLI